MKFIVNFFIILIFSSCAAWRLNDSDKIVTFPKEMQLKEKVALAVDFKEYQVFYNGEMKQDEINDQKKLEIKELILKAYEESDLFKLVPKGKATYIAEINLTQKGIGSMNQAILTGLTLFLYPSKSTDEFTITTIFKNQKNEVQAEFTKSDTVIMWKQLFLIFALPFKYPYKELKNVVIDLNRATILDAYHEPFLQPEL